MGRLSSLTFLIVALLLPTTTAIANEGPCKKDVLLGEDDTQYYCLPRRIVDDCKSKVGAADLNKCVATGCVRVAGEKLQAQRGACVKANETCLEDRGAIKPVIASITACLVGLATATPVASCYLGAMGGAAIRDIDVNVCRSRFGDCVEPGLKAHKQHVAFCSAGPKI